MKKGPGQESGQPWDWAAYVEWMVGESGSLAAAADRLAENRGHAEKVHNIERALRRLRGREQSDGGVWGRRCLRHFGVPSEITARVRWMGHYHSRFNDLPVGLCLELLRSWDRPPLSTSVARVWVQLGLASVALRREEKERALEHLEQARTVATSAAAGAEWALVMAFARRRGVDELLDRAEAHISELPPDEDRACLFARLIDQRAFQHNVLRRDYVAAHALYLQIPEDGPPFARVRRHSGLGWSCLKLGRRDEAVEHGQIAVVAAGDGGSLRLRAMCLRLLGRALEGEEAEAALSRAAAIAERLDDETLRVRIARSR